MADKTKPIGVISNLPQPPERKASDYLNAYKNWVYSATNHIGTLEAGVEINLYKKKIMADGTEDVEEVHEHPALSLLHFVNNFTTWNGLRQLTSAYRDLLGEAVWCLLRDGSGEPVEIWALRPDWVDVIPDEEEFVKEYRYRPNGGMKYVTIKKEDIIFFKDFSPSNPYRGMGKVKPSAYPLDIDEYADKYNRNFFFNDAMPSFLLTTDADIQKEEADRLVESFRNRFGGAEQSHKMGVLGGGKWNVEHINTGQKEVDYLNSKGFLRDQILSMFQVSKANIGIVEDVNRANQEASDARIMRHVVKPNLVWFVGFLNEFYLPNWADEGLFFNFEDPVPEDKDMKLRIYESGLKYGWLTRNEVRSQEGLEPVEGGDDIYLPSNNIGELPIQLSGKPAKLKKKMGLPTPVKRFKEFRKDKEKKRVKGDLVKLIGNIMKEVEVESKWYDADGKMYVWKELIADTDIKENIMTHMINELSREQEAYVLDKVTTHSKTLKNPRRYKLKPSTLVFGTGLETKKWTGVLLPFITRMISDKGEKTLRGFGISNFDIDSENIKEYLGSDGIKFIEEVNETTREQLISTIAIGIENNEAPIEIRKRIVEIYEAFRHNRSFVISRTETLRANNYATNEAYIQSGIVVKKEWLTAEDERSCPYCASLNGKTVSVEKNFFNKGDIYTVGDKSLDLSYGPTITPPLHPNCRCTVVPVTISMEKAKRLAQIKDVDEKVNKVAETVLEKVEVIKKVEQEKKIETGLKKLVKREKQIQKKEEYANKAIVEKELEAEKKLKEAEKTKEKAEKEAQELLEKSEKLNKKLKETYAGPKK